MGRFSQYLLITFLTTMLAFVGYSQDPIASYSFDGSAADASPLRNNANVHGASLTQDRWGIANRAFSFDGDQDYLEAANLAELNTEFTSVAFWTYTDALPPTGEAYLLTFGGWQERWKISLPSHGKMVWTTNNTTGISDMDAGDGNLVVPGQWQHWVRRRC